MSSGRTHISLLLLFIFHSFPSYTQVISLENTPIKKIAVNIRVNQIMEDHYGYLWLGTSEGLVRYDGLRYDVISVPDTIKSDVTSVFEDSHHKIWIGCLNGSVFQLENDSLILFDPEEGLPKKPVNKIIEDSSGIIWFSTYGEGVYYYVNKRLYNINTDDGLLSDEIYDLEIDSNNKMWLATDRGINICWLQDKVKNVKSITPEDGLPDYIVKSLQWDKSGKMWAGMYDGGFCYIMPRTDSVVIPIESKQWLYGPVSDIEIVDKHLMWIGTEGEGIFEITDGNLEVLSVLDDKLDFQNTKVKDIYSDREGNIWVAENKHGLSAVNSRFRLYKSVEGRSMDNIHAIASDKNNQIWFSTDKGLFMTSNPRDRQSSFKKIYNSSQLNNQIIISIYEDSLSNLWLGTFGGGIYILNPSSLEVLHITEEDGLVNNNILDITSKHDRLLFATLGGVSSVPVMDYFGEKKKPVFDRFDKGHGLGINYIYQVYTDTKNNVWIASDGKGLIRMKNGDFTFFGADVGLHSKVIYSITEDIYGNIWCSSAQEGLYKFDGDTFQRYDLEDGLSELNISSLTADENGNVIIIHNDGIDILNVLTENMVTYGRAQGIKGINPDLNVVTVDTNGHIWIGSQIGIIEYDPQKKEDRFGPVPQIKTVRLFLDPVQNNKTVFPHQQNHISFDIAGLWYQEPSEVNFQYQMEGYDIDWNTTTNRNITYPKLPSGEYHFLLRASLTENFDHSTVTSYSFTIKKAFWQQPWFILLGILLALFLIYTLIRIREKNLRRKESLEKERIRFQFETLRNQINPHFLFNSFNTLITLIEDDRSKAVTYVEKLSDFFRNKLQKHSENLVPLSEELESLKEYFYFQQSRFEDGLELEFEIKSENLKKYIPPHTLQLLAENAIKHNIISIAKPLKVEIVSNNKDYLRVKNNLQRKRSTIKSTHIGLNNIKERYKLLTDKKVSIRESADYYEVMIPLINLKRK